jgi:predicted RND superfamily exporter protein
VSGVLSRDRRLIELSIGLRSAATAPSEAVDRLAAALANPPRDVSATPAGLVGLTASTTRTLRSERWWLPALVAGLMALLLLAHRRRVDRALIPLAAPLIAGGLMSLALRAAGVSLTPLSEQLEPLTLAVGVEFGILLEARYREARRAGASLAAARAQAVRTTGASVMVSALAVGLAFSVLALSGLPMLREFGLLVGAEVVLCGALAVTVVPALAAALEHRPRRADRLAIAGIAP